MRIIIEFKPLEDNIDYYEINKYHIQSFIYSLLKNTKLHDLHDYTKFKFFTFSNIFPVTNFNPDENKKLIISSPNLEFIHALSEQLQKIDKFKLNKYSMELINFKVFKTKCPNSLITATPIVLYEDNRNDQYFSFKKGADITSFFERIKENAIKKYETYTGEPFKLDSDIFDSFQLKREVSVRVSRNRKTFVIIGSLWNELTKQDIKDNQNFYNFIYDAGLGEKCSLGFGFLNTRK